MIRWNLVHKVTYANNLFQLPTILVQNTAMLNLEPKHK